LHIQHRLAEGRWTSANTRRFIRAQGLGDFPQADKPLCRYRWQTQGAPMIAPKQYFFASEPESFRKTVRQAKFSKSLINI
jgi:hypothetical protein